MTIEDESIGDGLRDAGVLIGATAQVHEGVAATLERAEQRILETLVAIPEDMEVARRRYTQERMRVAESRVMFEGIADVLTGLCDRIHQAADEVEASTPPPAEEPN